MGWVETRRRTAGDKAYAINRYGDYRDYLRAELQRRKNLSPYYSLRDFAKQMRVSPSLLSRVLRGERGLSRRTAVRALSAMGISGKLFSRFLNQVIAQSGRSAAKRGAALQAMKKKFIVEARVEQEQFCEQVFTWGDQIKEYDRFGRNVSLKLRRFLFHRAKACGLLQAQQLLT